MKNNRTYILTALFAAIIIAAIVLIKNFKSEQKTNNQARSQSEKNSIQNNSKQTNYTESENNRITSMPGSQFSDEEWKDRKRADTPHKQKVLEPIRINRESMRRALIEKNVNNLKDLIEKIETGDAPELAYEKQMLEAAVRCLENLDGNAQKNALDVMDKHAASTIKKYLRRTCKVEY